jgi:hypothetical protein
VIGKLQRLGQGEGEEVGVDAVDSHEDVVNDISALLSADVTSAPNEKMPGEIRRNRTLPGKGAPTSRSEDTAGSVEENL